MENDQRWKHESKYKNAQDDHSYTSNATEEIGKTFVSYRHQNTIDSFWFAIKANIIVNPFDYVTVEQSHYKTIGIIQAIQTVAADSNYMIDDKQSSTSTNQIQDRMME